MLHKLKLYLAFLFVFIPSCAPLVMAQVGPGGTTYGSATITGGSINNTPIGQTTPAAITATNIVATGTLTVSPGTLGVGQNSLNFGNNIGLYSPGNNILSVALSGAEYYRFVSTLGMNIGSNNYLGWSSTTSSSGAPDTELFRDGTSGTLALRNGVNAQSFRVYNTYTDASNNEFLGVGWSANAAIIQTVNNGTGTIRAMQIGPSGAANLYLQTGGALRWQLNTTGFSPVTAGAQNIGSLSNYVAFIYTRFSMNVPTTVAALTACNGSNDGLRGFVTDSTLAYSGANLGTAVTGGGINHVPIYCDGSGTPAWKIGG